MMTRETAADRAPMTEAPDVAMMPVIPATPNAAHPDRPRIHHNVRPAIRSHVADATRHHRKERDAQ